MDGRFGSCHALELGFVFGTHVAPFFGEGPAADALSGQMMDAWLAFAKTGAPDTGTLGPWPAYGSGRETMIFGEDSGLEKAPHDETRAAWDDVPDSVIGSL